MLHDLRETYVRPGGDAFRSRSQTFVKPVAMWLVAFALSGALLFASLKFGIPASSGDLASLYLP
jgi:hypothetical protein